MRKAQKSRGDKTASEIRARTAKVLADRWRSRILMELSAQPLSPTQFVERAGGELDRIARSFRQLEEWGFIELVEVRQGRQTGAALEHVYRRIRRAQLDTQAWEELSPDRRDEFTDSNLESYIARINDATEAGTIDAEVDRHLSWDLVLLDRQAWSWYTTQLDATMFGLPELQTEALLRMAKSGEKPIPVTVGLAAFRSPKRPEAFDSKRPKYSHDPEGMPPSALVISGNAAKAFQSPTRSRIMMELRVRPMSPTQYVKEVGGSLSYVSRCFRQLAEWGLVEIIARRRNGTRSAAEKVYRSLEPAHIDTKTWEELPLFVREEFTASIFSSYLSRITEAINAGTFDADDDRHFSWDGVSLDRIAWGQLIARLDQLLYGLPRLEREAKKRMARSDEAPIPTVVGLAAFRSPLSSEITSKAPRTARKHS